MVKGKITKPALNAIRLYQSLAPYRRALGKALLPTSNPQSKSCRFTPTCSQYMYEAVESYGIVKGVSMGIRRIMRCHPWSAGGHDPLPQPQ